MCYFWDNFYKNPIFKNLGQSLLFERDFFLGNIRMCFGFWGRMVTLHVRTNLSEVPFLTKTTIILEFIYSCIISYVGQQNKKI